MVAELLGCQPLTGSAATKERVMSALTQAECAHFATHISWKLAALVLTPNPEGVPGGANSNVGTLGRGAGARRGSSGRGRKGSSGSGFTIPESLLMQDDSSDVESICDSPPLQEFLLTAADILDLRLPLKLVVLGYVGKSIQKTQLFVIDMQQDIMCRCMTSQLIVKMENIIAGCLNVKIQLNGIRRYLSKIITTEHACSVLWLPDNITH